MRGGGEHAGADVPDAGQLEQALDGAVLAERPVQQREDHVDLAEGPRHLAGLQDDEVGPPGERQGDAAPRRRPGQPVGPSTQPLVAGASTQRPSVAIPIGTTS